MTLPHAVPAQRAVDGIDLTWAISLGGETLRWSGRNTPTWWRTAAMTDEFRVLEHRGFRLTLHPGNNTCFVEPIQGG